MGEDVLNLEELFGQGKKLKVLWGEGEYELLRPAAFGARDTVRLNSLRRKVNALQTLDELNDQQVQELEEALDGVLGLLCPNLPLKEMPFAARLQVLTFYAMETQKKAWKAALRLLGEPPSAG